MKKPRIAGLCDSQRVPKADALGELKMALQFRRIRQFWFLLHRWPVLC